MNKERERFRRESLETTEDYQKRDVPFTKSSHFFRAFSFVAFRRVSCSLFERAEDDMLKKLGSCEKECLWERTERSRASKR